MTESPNVKVSAIQSGQVKSSYFKQLDFITIGDKYIDPSRRQQLDELEKKKLIKNEAIFKPASGYKEMLACPYDYPLESTHPTPTRRKSTPRPRERTTGAQTGKSLQPRPTA